MLALQSPMASDLRAIITALRLVSEIERSADLMVNIARRPGACTASSSTRSSAASSSA